MLWALFYQAYLDFKIILDSILANVFRLFPGFWFLIHVFFWGGGLTVFAYNLNLQMLTDIVYYLLKRLKRR